jgi:hypothetical protein
VGGKAENVAAAQRAFAHRAHMNGCGAQASWKRIWKRPRELRNRLPALSDHAAEVRGQPFAEQLKRALGAGDVASLQLRLKDVSDDDILRAGEMLMPIAQRAAWLSS